MTPEARDVLRRIGAELDGHRQVRVRVGGIVLPEPEPAEEEEASDNEYQQQPREQQPRERRSRERRSRERRSRERQRRPRAPGPPAPLRSVDFRAQCEAQVGDLAKAYPSARVVASDEQGMWLQIESAVLSGLDRAATFLVAISFDSASFPRAWGFWKLPDGPQWIGARHTNFTDGSICAFVPDSGTWRPGDPLDLLLDLYSVWALRHLYLEQFGRWPGGQYSPHPFYSLIEFKADELCSCDLHDPPQQYGVCCRPQHMRMNFVRMKADFERAMGCRITDRTPPAQILSFVAEGGGPLSVREALAVPAVINRSR